MQSRHFLCFLPLIRLMARSSLTFFFLLSSVKVPWTAAPCWPVVSGWHQCGTPKLSALLSHPALAFWDQTARRNPCVLLLKPMVWGKPGYVFLAEKPGYFPEMANLAAALAKASCFCRSPTNAIYVFLWLLIFSNSGGISDMQVGTAGQSGWLTLRAGTEEVSPSLADPSQADWNSSSSTGLRQITLNAFRCIPGMCWHIPSEWVYLLIRGSLWIFDFAVGKGAWLRYTAVTYIHVNNHANKRSLGSL